MALLGRCPLRHGAGDRDRRPDGDALRGIRAVLFDAGRTLLEPDPPAERVYAEAFSRYGVAVDDEDVLAAIEETWWEVRERGVRGEERWGGDGGEEGFWKRFAGRVYARCGGGDLPEECFAALVSHFARPLHWKVYPEVHGVLSELRARGLKLAVVSNWDTTLPDLLERLSLAAYFDVVVVSASFGQSKPSPAIFHEALRLLGLPPESALHVGDSLSEDWEAASAAGLSALWLDRTGKGLGDVPFVRDLSGVARHL